MDFVLIIMTVSVSILLGSFFLKVFLMQTTFKVFIEFVTILLLLYIWVWGHETWEILAPPTRDLTCTPCFESQSLNHCTTKEVPLLGSIRYQIRLKRQYGKIGCIVILILGLKNLESREQVT